MAPTSTAVFRAVADFQSLNRSVKQTRAEIENLQRQSGKTGEWDKFDKSLQKITETQQKLRTETKQLSAEQAKLGRSSGTTNLASSLGRLTTATDKARTATTALSGAQARQQGVLAQNRANITSLTTAMRSLASAEESATKSAQNHAKSLSDERSSADKKASSLNKLSDALHKTAARDRDAASSADMHAEALDRESRASGTASMRTRELGVATTESGRSAKISAGDHDLLAESLARLSPAASGAGSSLRGHSTAATAAGASSRSAASGQTSLASALNTIAPAARNAASSSSSAASQIRSVGSASSSSSSGARTLSNALNGVGTSSRSSSQGVNVLGGALSPLKSSLRSAGDAGSGLKTILAGLTMAGIVPGITLLVGSLSALVSGLVAVAAAVGPAVGALAALGPAAVAAAGAIGTTMLAFRGVGDALKAMTKVEQESSNTSSAAAKQRVAAAQAIGAAQRGVRDAIQGQQDAEKSGARAVADAQRALDRARSDAADAAVAASRRVQDANDDLIRANQAVIRAEQDLHDARRQAIRDLEDLAERTGDNALSQEGAEIRLLRAQERLSEINADSTSTALDRREALLAVAEAEDNLSDVQRQSARDATDLNAAQKGGIDGMPGVVSAQDSLSGALDAQRQSAQDLKDAQAAAARQQSDSAQQIGDAERNLAEAREDAARRNRDAAESVQDALLRLAEAQAAATESSGAMSAASRDLAAALEKLSPQGLKLVEMLKALQPRLNDMSKAAQEAMFPGLIRALQILTPLIDTVAIPALDAFGRALGWVAEAAATEIASWEKDLVDFGTGAGPQLIREFGQILINLMGAMEDVGVAAVPLLQWLSSLGLRLSQYWEQEAQAGRRDGSLAAYFDRVRATLELLGNIIYNVGGIIKEVFTGASPTGTGLLADFEKLTRETRNWMGTAEGRNAISEYFEKVRPNVELVLEILGKVAKAFIDMGASETLTTLLTSIRDILGPSISRFIDAMGESLARVGPQLVELLAGVLDFFSTLTESGSGGGISAFIAVIGGIVDILNAIVNVPLFAWLISAVLAFKGATIAMKAFGKVAAAIPGMSLLNNATGTAGKGAATAGGGFRAGLTGSQNPASTGTGRLGQAAGSAVRSGAGAIGAAAAAPFRSGSMATRQNLPPIGAPVQGPVPPPPRVQPAPRPTPARGAAAMAPIIDPGRADAAARALRGMDDAQASAARSAGSLGQASAAASGSFARQGSAADAAAQSTARTGAAAGQAASGMRGVGSAAAGAASGVSKIGSESDKASKNVGKVGSTSADAAKNVGKIGNEAGKAASSVSKVGNEAGKAASSVSKIGTESGKAASSVGKVGAAATGAATAVGGLAPAADAASTKTTSAFSRISSTVGSTASRVGTAFSSAFSSVTSGASSVASNVSTRFSDAATRVGTAFSSVSSRVGAALSPIVTSATNVGRDAYTGMKSWSDRIAGSWTGTYDPIAKSAEAAATKVGDSSRKMADEVDRSGKRVGTAMRDLDSAVGSAASSTTGHLRGVGSAAGEASDAVNSAGKRAAGAADGIGAVGTAAGTAGGLMGGLRGAAGGLSAFLGGPWGVAIMGAVAAIGLLTWAYTEFGSKAEENAQKAIDGSLSLAAAIKAEQEQTDKAFAFYLSADQKTEAHAIAQAKVTEEYKKTYDALSPLKQAESDASQAQYEYNEAVKKYTANSPQAIAAADAWRIATDKVEWEQKAAADATKSHSEKIQEQRDLLFASLDADLAKRQSMIDVKTAQQDYNTAIAENGPKSAEAEQAQIRLEQSYIRALQSAANAGYATQGLTTEEDKAKAATDAQNAAALELIKTHDGPLPEALRKVIAGMDESALAAAGATFKTDEFGNRVATLDGKTVVLDANRQPGDVVIDGFEARGIDPKTVDIHANTKPANDTIWGWLRGLWDSIGRFFGAGGSGAPVDPAGPGGGNFHAGGGVVPGYSPGRDTVPAVLSPGEAVLVPELVKKIGAKNILRANKEASGRSPSGNSAAFAGGGIVGRPKVRGGAGVGGTTAPAPVDAAGAASAAKAIGQLTSQMTALTPQLKAAQTAGTALVTSSLQPLAQRLGVDLVSSLTSLRESGLLPLRSDLALTQQGTDVATQAMTGAMQLYDAQANAALENLRAAGLAPLRTDLTTTQTHEQATTTAMTNAMNLHRDLSNAAMLNIRTLGLNPLRTDLTTTQVHEQATTTAMTNAINLHRDLSNAAMLNVRTAGLLPLRTDLTTTQVSTQTNTGIMSGAVEQFRDRADSALAVTRQGLAATDTATANTATWFRTQMDTMRESAAAPVRAVISGPFNAGIIAAWNTLDSQFALGKSVAPIAIPFAKGGPLTGGEANKDSIPIMGMPGEYMLSKKAVKRLGGQGQVDQWHNKLRTGLRPQEIDQGGDKSAPGWSHMADGGPVGIAQNFARSQAGKPYLWGGVGPGGYDCSGFMSAIVGSLTGGNPYSRRFSTASFAGGPTAGFVRGLQSQFSIGVMQGNPGHMAGTLGGMNVESRGGAGVLVGGGARGADNGLFTQQFSLPQVGGAFVSGGGGGAPFDPTPMINAAFADTYKMIEGFGATENQHQQRLAGIAKQAADMVKAKALSAVSAATALSGPLGAPSADVQGAVRGVAARYGWGEGPQWDALSRLIQGESSWNPAAANPNSSARGLFQKMTSLHGPIESTPAGQAEWGLNYIRSAYGDPVNAYTKWSSRSPHWYANGGYVPGRGNGDTEPAMLTPGEFVLTRPAAEAIGPGNLEALNSLRPGAFSPNAAQYMALGGVVQKSTGPAYQIRRGDTLSGIAKSYGTTIAELQRLNKIANPNKIYSGAWLNLPKKATPGASPTPSSAMGRHQIQLGDTLSALAKRFGTSTQELQRLNNIADPNKIYAGAWLSYPKKATTSPPTPAPAPKPTEPATPAPAGDSSADMTLEQWAAGIGKNTADTKEFEANLLKLSGWGYDDLALALAKMGMTTSGTDNAGGLSLSRQAVKSPSAAAAVEKIIEDSKTVIGDNLENALAIIGALRKKTGQGIREVSTESKIDTKDIFDVLSSSATVLAEIAKLPSGNKDKFLSNWDAYKKGLPFALGGRVPGTGRGDTVPAMLTPGEFVIRKDAARAIGVQSLQRLNQADQIPTQAFAGGGQVMSAEDLFSLTGPPQFSRPGVSRTMQQKLAGAVGRSGDTTNAKSVVFSEGAVQVHNPAPARATDSFDGVMRKLSWSGTFS